MGSRGVPRVVGGRRRLLGLRLGHGLARLWSASREPVVARCLVVGDGAGAQADGEVGGAQFEDASFRSLLVRVFPLHVAAGDDDGHAFLLAVGSGRQHAVLQVFGQVSAGGATDPCGGAVLPLAGLRVLGAAGLGDVERGPYAAVLSGVEFDAAGVSADGQRDLVDGRHDGVPFLVGYGCSVFGRRPVPSSVWVTCCRRDSVGLPGSLVGGQVDGDDGVGDVGHGVGWRPVVDAGGLHDGGEAAAVGGGDLPLPALPVGQGDEVVPHGVAVFVERGPVGVEQADEFSGLGAQAFGFACGDGVDLLPDAAGGLVVDAVRGLFPCLVPEVGGLLGFGGVEGEAFPPGDAHLPCAGVGGLCLAGDGGRYPVLAHDGVLSCVVDRLSGYPLFFLFGLSVKRSVTGQSGFRPIDRAGRSPLRGALTGSATPV